MDISNKKQTFLTCCLGKAVAENEVFCKATNQFKSKRPLVLCYGIFNSKV